MKLNRHLILFGLIALFSSKLEGQVNRYSNLSFSTLNDIQQPDPYLNYKLLDDALKARREKAILECYASIVSMYRDWVQEDKASIEIIEPVSEWIDIIEYYRNTTDGSQACVLFVKNSNDVYVFKMDEATWQNWKNSTSKGQFYNLFIRDVPRYSFRTVCEIVADSKN